MPSHSLKHFYETYLSALEAGDAALFVGAGLSRASGFVDWKELMRDIADDIGLSVDRESDLIAIAQYHVNTKRKRSALNQKLLKEFTKDAAISENHRLIASLPIPAIWTTNYDTLLEDAFREAHKRPDVKSTQANLAQSLPRRDVSIYKMHGDISQPQNAVLTKHDYEVYNTNRGLFTEKLQGDLVSKTFLFLGFSFSDPNIDYVLARLHVFLDQDVREHFCVMKRPSRPRGKGKRLAEYEYEARKFDLRVADLSRYGITTLEVDDYAEISEILTTLNQLGHRKDIFVSASAHDFEPLGRDRIDEIARRLGSEIIKRGYSLVSGFGLGIGSAVAMGAMESLFEEESEQQDRRVILRPFPQVTPKGLSNETFQTKYREAMLAQSGVVIYLCGNKRNGRKGGVIQSPGVMEEFKIATKKGLCPIPIGCTGHAALSIWKTVSGNPKKYFRSPAKVQAHLKALGNAKSSDDQIVRAVFGIVDEWNSD